MATTLLAYFFGLLTKLHLAPPIPTPVPDRLAPIPDEEITIDNTIYDRDTFSWWDSSCGLHHLNPVRIAYFFDKLARYEAELDPAPASEPRRIVDLGCGGGIATESLYLHLSRRPPSAPRYTVEGLDQSALSLAHARRHAATSHAPPLALVYTEGDLYALPYAPRSLDALHCSDVFEHLTDLGRALAEIARVLKPGGFVAFDTINRTPLAFYLSIWILQDLLPAAIDQHAHDHRLYITPAEIDTACRHAGLVPGPSTDLTGLRPAFQWPHVAVWRLCTGRGFMDSVLTDFKLSSNLQVSYLYWARKPR